MSEQDKAQLKKAFELIQNGNYEKARYILRGIEHPKAMELLQRIDGQRDKAKPFISMQSIVITVLAVIALIALSIVIIQYGSILAQFNFEMEQVESQFPDDEDLYLDAVSYCYDFTGYGGELCLDWTDHVLENYSIALSDCFAPYRNNAYVADEHFITVQNCLRSADVPDPL